MKVVSVKLELTMIDMVDAYGIKHGMNRSEVIRRALLKLLEKKGSVKPTNSFNETLRAIAIKIEEEDLEKIDKYAKENHVNRSDVIRQAIRDELAGFVRESVPRARVEKMRL